jgi:hypothetical protein
LVVSFDELREQWLADECIGRSHLIVMEEPGIADAASTKILLIIQATKLFGRAPLLEAADRYNDEVCQCTGERQWAGTAGWLAKEVGGN